VPFRGPLRPALLETKFEGIVVASRITTLLSLLSFATISYSAGCAPLDSSTQGKPQSVESQRPQADAGSVPPGTIKLWGVLEDYRGERLTGTISVLFAIYDQQTDGAPLWQEVQNVSLDQLGHFNAEVGSATSGGIPAYLFGAEKTRWLGTQVLLPDEVEQPRIRLKSASQGLTTARSVGFAKPTASGDKPALPAQSGDQLASTSTESQRGSGETADSQSASPQDPSGPDNESPTTGRRSPWHRRSQ
jgi:hypothetical protein